MEFGAFLKSLHGPEERFRIAVSANDLAGVMSCIDLIKDINAVVESQLKRRALHIACRNGNTEMIALLIEKGANPNIADAIGILPWHMAVNSGLQRGLRLILATSPVNLSSFVWEKIAVGNANHPALPSFNHHFVISLLPGKNFALSDNLISTFIKAIIPDILTENGNVQCQNFLIHYANVEILVKLFIVCGNYLAKETRDILFSHCSPDLQDWLKQSWCKPWSLQAICRSAIRRHLKHNTFFSISYLDYPEQLKNYLAFNFDDEYEVLTERHLPAFPLALRNFHR